jgi:hypothetical protein
MTPPLIEMYCPKCKNKNTVLNPAILSNNPAKLLLCKYCGKALMELAENNKGYVYILSHSNMPGLLKIGMTERSIEERVNELSSSTGVPGKFIIEAYFPSTDPYKNEHDLHMMLDNFRVSKSKEFFQCPLEEAVRCAKIVCPEASLMKLRHPIRQLTPSEFVRMHQQ